MRRCNKKSIIILCALAAIAPVFLIVHHFTGTVCLFNAVTGIPCPGCGLTRSLRLALRGNFAESFAMHPLLLPTLALLGYLFLSFIILKKKPTKLFYTIIILFTIVFLGFYVWRMVNFFPSVPPMIYNSHSFLRR